MRVCPKCERNIFNNEESCSNCGATVEVTAHKHPQRRAGEFQRSNCGATVEVTAQAPAASQRTYGMFTGFCTVYLILCLFAAFGCFLAFIEGLPNSSLVLLAIALIAPISGFILYGFSRLAVDAANDIRIMAEKASVRSEQASPCAPSLS